MAFRSVMMLAVLFTASLTQSLASPFSVTIRSGQGVTYTLAPNCDGNFSNAPFTLSDFHNAEMGSAAAVISPDPRWIQSLTCDPQAQWISTNTSGQGHTALFAQRFTLPCRPIEDTVTLTFCWAVDDHLGDPPNGAPNMGVFINGVPLPIKGGTYNSQSTVTVPVPTSILNAGVNYLYVYVWEWGCGSVGGVIYSATIRGMCRSCTLDNEQPWNKCLPSELSAVIDCAPPTPQNTFLAHSADDFVATYTGPVNTVEWWGTLSHPSQRKRPFLIAFYPQHPAWCLPSHRNPIFYACVKPVAKPVGVDCEGRRVWHFSARLPAPYFNQVQGQKYWLVIAEVDSASIRPGEIDFRWSGHAACNNCESNVLVCNCRATKFTPNEPTDWVITPILGCNGEVVDLAWALRWRTRIFIKFNTQLPGAITARLYIPDGAMIESHALIVEHDDDEASPAAVFDTALPEGEYVLEILSNGALAKRVPVTLSGGVLEIDANDLLWGDLNMDGSIDDADLLMVLFNFGADG
jgi:hypothetical protein